MAYDFGADWAADVEAVTSSPEFQNATVSLQTPATDAVYDIDTGEWTGGEPTVLVESTRARIIGINQPNNVSGSVADNPTSVRRIRVQIPFAAYPDRVLPGTIIKVLDGGRNPALESYLITVVADNFSSQRASHTLDCTADAEVEAQWE